MERKGPVEQLDSALFSLETLVDYQASFDGTLCLEARTLDGSGEAWLKETAGKVCPNKAVTVQVSPAHPEDVPMYPGKRYVRTLK